MYVYRPIYHPLLYSLLPNLVPEKLQYIPSVGMKICAQEAWHTRILTIYTQYMHAASRLCFLLTPLTALRPGFVLRPFETTAALLLVRLRKACYKICPFHLINSGCNIVQGNSHTEARMHTSAAQIHKSRYKNITHTISRLHQTQFLCLLLANLFNWPLLLFYTDA